ncbi:MAG: hypothetical protein JO356_00860 [Acidobacteria bacterium]|nr:hypothetical protein [Acidobacteriota bacterium]
MKAQPETRELKNYHYWDFAGQLTARLNQSYLVIAALALVAALEGGALFYAFQRLAHPPIFRVAPNGELTIAGARSDGPPPSHAHFLPTAELPLDEVSIKHFLRTFLTKYLSYQPATADENLAAAFNMMTVNLRSASLKKMRDDGEFEKIQAQRIVSNFSIVRIDPVKDVNLAYTVLGVREIHHLEDAKESISKIVAHYNVRLAPAVRTEYDASGLRVADFWEDQVMGEENKNLVQQDDLTHEAANRQVSADANTIQQ